MSWVELETKVAEDYAKFYNHGEWAYSMIVKLRVIFGNLRFKLYSWARTLQSTRLRLASRTLMLGSKMETAAVGPRHGYISRGRNIHLDR